MSMKLLNMHKGKNCADTVIVLNLQTYNTREEHEMEATYTREAATLFEAIVGTLPCGVYDRLISKLWAYTRECDRKDGKLDIGHVRDALGDLLGHVEYLSGLTGSSPIPERVLQRAREALEGTE